MAAIQGSPYYRGMDKKPTAPENIDQAWDKLGEAARAELRRRGMTESQIEAALKKKGRKPNA